jgi:hypothetical protein
MNQDCARQQLVGVQTLNPHARPRRSLRPLHRAAPGRPASRSDRWKSHRAIVYEFVGGEYFALPMTQYVWRHAAVVIQPLAGTWPRRLRARERRQPAVGPGARTWLTSSGQQVHRRSGPPGIRRAVTHTRLPGISRTANILAQPIAWPSAERSSPRGAWSHCWVSPVSPPHRLAGCNEYGGIEYGGLPAFHAFAAIPPVPQPHRGFATKVKRRLSNIRSAYSVTPSQDSSFEVPAPHGDCFW